MDVEKKLLVVGSINIDLVACANRIPAPGESILGHSFDVFNGGKGANQAVAIAKLGAQVDMIASLGTDLFTERLLSGLKVAGVDTHAVRIVPGPCGVALISRADNGGKLHYRDLPGQTARYRLRISIPISMKCKKRPGFWCSLRLPWRR